MTQASSRPRRLPLNPADASVTPLELFFDLVFVFALTQVTAFMAEDVSGQSLVRGVLVLVLLWWAWTGYAWLCNVVSADAGAVRVVLLTAMAAMFVLALTIPEAFDDLPGGLNGPVVLAACYFVFRFMHLVMFWLISRDDPGLRRQVARFAPSVFGGTITLLVASTTDGHTQTLLWVVALTVDYVGTLLGGADGWRVRSPGHFAERHGLILIVALGESIVAIGVGVAELPISVPIVVASVLGLGVAASLWWIYFDMSALHAEHALAAEPEETRARLARDAYSFLHVPLLIGVVLTALGLKKVLEYVGDVENHGLDDPLKGAALLALHGGVFIYLLGHVAFKWRTAHALIPARLVAAGALVGTWALGPHVPALATLGTVVGVVALLVAYETVVYAEHRRALHPH
jgi:low temperature requirement protein LtrA